MSTPTSNSVSASSIPLSADYFVNALTGTAYFWGANSIIGVGAELDFSFNSSPQFYTLNYSTFNEPAGASALTEAQQVAVRSALMAWADVADLHFNEIVEGEAAVGDLRFGIFNAMHDIPGYANNEGWAYLPSSQPSAGDIWLSPSLVDTNYLPVGSDSYYTIIHEIGHALGFKHPFVNDSTVSGSSNTLTGVENTQLYSVMAYESAPNSLFLRVTEADGQYIRNYFNVLPDGPMLYDIAGMQYLYGANQSSHAGDDIYTFDTAIPFLRTIWDAGGNDTISVSNFLKPCIIDLRNGYFSSIRIESDPFPAGVTPGEGDWLLPTYDGTDNLAIAFGALIENAIGGAANDRLIGNAVDNLLRGLGDNDTLSGGAGNDTIDGGNGIDTADYGSATSGLSLALFSGVVSNDGQGGADTLLSIENLIGSGFNDTINGSAVANRLDGGAGNDLIFAGGGDDTLVGGDGNDQFGGAAGNDSIDGGNGIDTADYTSALVGISLALFSGVVANDGQGGSDIISNIENLIGSGFNDTISGSAVANRLDGGAGNDLLFAGAGDDTLVGGEGNDTLGGAAGNDAIDGGNGNDTADYTGATSGLALALFSGVVSNDGQSGTDTISNIENLNGSAFNDTISGSAVANRLDGGAGNDLIFAGAGDDTLVGGEGNDTLNGAAGNDAIDGGNGIDTADYTSALVGISLALFSGVVANDGQGGADTVSNIENLIGSGFNDTINGSSVANRIDGGAGSDLIYAGAGNDILLGGANNDTLSGGSGNDQLTGGTGQDAFRFDSVLGPANLDLITDFIVVDDTIQLENAIFTRLATPGALAAGSFVSSAGAAALDADDYILYDTGTGKLYYDADAIGEGLAQQFSTLTGLPGILASDFLVV